MSKKVPSIYVRFSGHEGPHDEVISPLVFGPFESVRFVHNMIHISPTRYLAEYNLGLWELSLAAGDHVGRGFSDVKIGTSDQVPTENAIAIAKPRPKKKAKK